MQLDSTLDESHADLLMHKLHKLRRIPPRFELRSAYTRLKQSSAPVFRLVLPQLLMLLVCDWVVAQQLRCTQPASKQSCSLCFGILMIELLPRIVIRCYFIGCHVLKLVRLLTCSRRLLFDKALR